MLQDFLLVAQAVGLDHVLLEDGDGPGHRPDLVGARQAGDLRGLVALGETGHRAGHAGHRPGDAARDQEGEQQADEDGGGRRGQVEGAGAGDLALGLRPDVAECAPLGLDRRRGLRGEGVRLLRHDEVQEFVHRRRGVDHGREGGEVFWSQFMRFFRQLDPVFLVQAAEQGSRAGVEEGELRPRGGGAIGAGGADEAHRLEAAEEQGLLRGAGIGGVLHVAGGHGRIDDLVQVARDGGAQRVHLVPHQGVALFAQRHQPVEGGRIAGEQAGKSLDLRPPLRIDDEPGGRIQFGRDLRGDGADALRIFRLAAGGEGEGVLAHPGHAALDRLDAERVVRDLRVVLEPLPGRGEPLIPDEGDAGEDDEDTAEAGIDAVTHSEAGGQGQNAQFRSPAWARAVARLF